MSYLCSGHDVCRLDHVQQPAVLRLVDRDSPIMKDEKLLIALTQQTLFYVVGERREKKSQEQEEEEKYINKRRVD